MWPVALLAASQHSRPFYHASYLRFMERGRTNYLRLIGADHRALFEQAAAEAPGFAFVVRHMDIAFRKPAVAPPPIDDSPRTM